MVVRDSREAIVKASRESRSLRFHSRLWIKGGSERLFSRFLTNDSRDSSPGLTLAARSLPFFSANLLRGIRNVAVRARVFEGYLIRVGISRKGTESLLVEIRFPVFPRVDSRVVRAKRHSRVFSSYLIAQWDFVRQDQNYCVKSISLYSKTT